MSGTTPTASRAAGRLAAFGAVTLWGVSFVATKSVLQELSPVTLLFGRFALGSAVLLLIVRLRGERLPPPRTAWPMLALMGFVGVFVHHMLQVHGLALTTAVRTGWLIGIIPIWSALLSGLLGHERFGPGKILGLVVGTLGALLVITRGELSPRTLALPSTRGDLLVLLSTVNWAIYTVLGRGTLRGLGSARATALSVFLGWGMLVPFFVAAGGWRELADLSGHGLAALLFLGIGCSGLGYLLWYAALGRLETSKVAAFLHVEPLITFVAALAILHEPVAATTILGGALVLAGVGMVQRAS